MTKKQKIVIVDDDAEAKGAYEIAFAGSGLDLVYITSSLEALSYLTARKVDAVLIDLAMREMDGLTLAKQIRINEEGGGHHARLAWFTSRSIGEVEKRVMERNGVEEVFTKPTDPFALIHEIQAWLSTPMPEPVKKIPHVFSNQNGAVMPTLVTAVSFTVVLIIVISIYNRVLHNKEEDAAYRYSEKRNEYKQIKEICDKNFETDATLQKWLEQNKIKPPAPYLIQKLCVVTKKEENE